MTIKIATPPATANTNVALGTVLENCSPRTQIPGSETVIKKPTITPTKIKRNNFLFLVICEPVSSAKKSIDSLAPIPNKTNPAINITAPKANIAISLHLLQELLRQLKLQVLMEVQLEPILLFFLLILYSISYSFSSIFFYF